MIDRQVARTPIRGTRLRTGAALLVGLLALVGTVYAGAPADAPGVRAMDRGADTTAVEAAAADLQALEARVDRVNRGWARLASYYESEVAPIERVLLSYRDDEALAGRIGAAIVREARAAALEPRLLLAVLLVENPWLDPDIRSSVGAVGLMQVMPVHRGGWSCGWDLEDIDTNVCLGARVFAHYLDRTSGDVEKALLRYNGCVTGSNTPNCHQYPYHVFARAGRASVLAWVGQPSPGSP